MRKSPRSRFTLGLLALALLLGGALLAVLLATHTETSGMHSRANNDRVWHVSNLPYEEMQAIRGLSDYLIDPGAEREESAVRQLEIYWVRLDVLLSGTNRSLLREDFPGVLDYIAAQFEMLRRHEAVFDELTPERAGALLKAFEKEREAHLETAFAVSQLSYENYEALVDRVTGAYRTASGLLVGFIFCILLYTLALLREARKNAELTRLAEAASEAKSRFLANVSHELRTPLNGIIGTVSLIDGASVAPSQREHLETLRVCSDALLSQVNEVLDFSRLERTEISLRKEVFEPGQLARDSFSIIANTARAKGLEPELVLGDLPRAVRGDSARLRQVLVNLLGNALKFTDRGWIRYTVEWDPEVSSLIFAIADSGRGIPPDELPKVFDAFHQVDVSLSRQHEGSGLGLAITRSLVEAMGGTVTVHSELGVGTTFSVILPVNPDDVLPAEDVEASELAVEGPDEERPRAALEGARVLVAEDNPVNLKVVTMMLSRYGVDVLPASNGLEVIAQIEGGGMPVDVVLMDCQMPQLDGIEASRRLRASGHRLPIIALTADVTEMARRDCLAAGMDAFLIKPINMEILIDTVCRHLPAKRLDRASVS